MDADFPGRIQAPDRRIRPDLPKLVLPSGREQPSIGTPDRVNAAPELVARRFPRTRRQAKAVLNGRLGWFSREERVREKRGSGRPGQPVGGATPNALLACGLFAGAGHLLFHQLGQYQQRKWRSPGQ